MQKRPLGQAVGFVERARAHCGTLGDRAEARRGAKGPHKSRCGGPG